MHSNLDPIVQRCYWWSAISLRIANKDLDPSSVTEILGISPTVSLVSGESQVHHRDCKSAGYWCGGKREDFPIRPSELITWIETLVDRNQLFLKTVIDAGADVNIYLGIHLDVASIGFEIPTTPTINQLGIRIGIEFFGR